FGVQHVLLHVVQVGRPHLLRQRARRAAQPLAVVRRRGPPAAHGPAVRWQPEAPPHLRAPEPAVREAQHGQQGARGAHDEPQRVVVDVERRHREHQHRRRAQQREREDVHVHVAEPQALHVPPEHAERARQRQRRHRRVVADVEQPAGPLRLRDHRPVSVAVTLRRHRDRVRLVDLRVQVLLVVGGRRDQHDLPAERAVHHVQGGDDGEAEAERHAEVDGQVRAVVSSEEPEERAVAVLREARGVEQQHDGGHVEALAAQAGGAVLAVEGTELGDVGGAPSEE
ncbi:Os11g0109666, partial [Oryza sativa Japonica Group]